jgi:hypothetical protein
MQRDEEPLDFGTSRQAVAAACGQFRERLLTVRNKLGEQPHTYEAKDIVDRTGQLLAHIQALAERER